MGLWYRGIEIKIHKFTVSVLIIWARSYNELNYAIFSMENTLTLPI